MNIKVTPPEIRGRKGYVAVEIYNLSKKDLGGADFWISLETEDFMEISAHITVGDMRRNWSEIRWIKIPVRGKIPKIKRLSIQRMQMFDVNGNRAKIQYTTDLIKS